MSTAADPPGQDLADQSAADTPTTKERRLQPALIVNTGDGKGKTTAAMGLALRAWHQGWSIGVYQFIKSGRWPNGERAALAALGAEHDRSGIGGPVQWHALGTGRSALRPTAASDPAEAARAAWDRVKVSLVDQEHQLYLLDEFTYPLQWGWLDLTEVIQTLADRPASHVVITGRGAPPELVEIATTVTEMTKIKHPHDSGQKGQAGIEW